MDPLYFSDSDIEPDYYQVGGELDTKPIYIKVDNSETTTVDINNIEVDTTITEQQLTDLYANINEDVNIYINTIPDQNIDKKNIYKVKDIVFANVQYYKCIYNTKLNGKIYVIYKSDTKPDVGADSWNTIKDFDVSQYADKSEFKKYLLLSGNFINAIGNVDKYKDILSISINPANTSGQNQSQSTGTNQGQPGQNQLQTIANTSGQNKVQSTDTNQGQLGQNPVMSAANTSGQNQVQLTGTNTSKNPVTPTAYNGNIQGQNPVTSTQNNGSNQGQPQNSDTNKGQTQNPGTNQGQNLDTNQGQNPAANNGTNPGQNQVQSPYPSQQTKITTSSNGLNLTGQNPVQQSGTNTQSSLPNDLKEEYKTYEPTNTSIKNTTVTIRYIRADDNSYIYYINIEYTSGEVSRSALIIDKNKDTNTNKYTFKLYNINRKDKMTTEITSEKRREMIDKLINKDDQITTA